MFTMVNKMHLKHLQTNQRVERTNRAGLRLLSFENFDKVGPWQESENLNFERVPTVS